MCSTPAFMNPVIKATCSIDKNEIAAGEYAKVIVTVEGDAVEQIIPVPTAVVLTLDESGSMGDNNNYAESRKAALAVINSLRPNDEVALVTFSDSAVIRSNLTTDHNSVKQILQNLGSPSGLTNLAEAFTVSATIAKGSLNSNNRMVILFTDGMPTPDQTDQENIIVNSLGQVQADLIHYYPVAYGSSIPLALLNMIAQKTGGLAVVSNQITDLTKYFQDAFDDLKNMLFTQDVRITEIVNPEFVVRQDSLNYSIASSEEPADFKKAMKNAEAFFYSSGTLIVPPIYLLNKNRNFTFSFEVTAKKCNPKTELLKVNSGASNVTYSLGAGTKMSTPINQVQVTVKACGVYWRKYFEKASRRVVVEINNTFGDREVLVSRVSEVPAEEVEFLSNYDPPWPMAQVYYASHAKSTWTGPYAVRWENFIIPPKTIKTFSAEVKLRSGVKAVHGFDNPLKINQEKVLPVYEPDGKIANEPKEGGTISFMYTDYDNTEKTVSADLPGLTIDELPIQWPYT